MGGRDGGPRRKGYMYKYGRFVLLYGRNEHNVTVKILKNKKTVQAKSFKIQFAFTI